MKVTRTKVADYDSPKVEVFTFNAASIFCVSNGENEGTGEDDWGDDNN